MRTIARATRMSRHTTVSPAAIALGLTLLACAEPAAPPAPAAPRVGAVNAEIDQSRVYELTAQLRAFGDPGGAPAPNVWGHIELTLSGTLLTMRGAIFNPAGAVVGRIVVGTLTPPPEPELPPTFRPLLTLFQGRAGGPVIDLQALACNGSVVPLSVVPRLTQDLETKAVWVFSDEFPQKVILEGELGDPQPQLFGDLRVGDGLDVGWATPPEPDRAPCAPAPTR